MQVIDIRRVLKPKLTQVDKAIKYRENCQEKLAALYEAILDGKPSDERAIKFFSEAIKDYSEFINREINS
jgi:hypothetical protein